MFFINNKNCLMFNLKIRKNYYLFFLYWKDRDRSVGDKSDPDVANVIIVMERSPVGQIVLLCLGQQILTRERL